jgi:putative heme-binding domain-containing protein
LGPDLKGAAARLSRIDLFRAIVDPNLEVSPAYQTTVIVTGGGQVYHGLIVYESPETTMLQTDPDTTVRITNTDASSVRRSTQSLMPTGLLDPLSDQDLSDLYAYLQTLEAK